MADQSTPKGASEVTDSREAKSLAEALLGFQTDAPLLARNAQGYGYKYTPLDEVMRAIQPVLSKHQLLWTASPGRDEHGLRLDYRLIHAASGEEITGSIPLIVKNQGDVQAYGSALTYARRYALLAVLNLASSDDDDGHAARQGSSEGAGPEAPAEAPAPAQAAPAKAAAEEPDDEEVRDKSRQIVAILQTDFPSAYAAFGEWCSKRRPKITSLNDLEGPVLRGVHTKLLKLRHIAEQRRAETVGEEPDDQEAAVPSRAAQESAETGEEGPALI